MQYKGIEEVVNTVSELKIADYRTVFLFVIKNTGQLFTQIFADEEEEPCKDYGSDCLFCGKLGEETTYEDIIRMVDYKIKQDKADERYIRWLEKNGYLDYE